VQRKRVGHRPEVFRRSPRFQAAPNFAAQVRKRRFYVFTFSRASTLAIASPENSHLCVSDARRTRRSGHIHRRIRLLIRRAPTCTAGPFPPGVAPGVYHSFPALFCAGDSRIVERSFVTCFRRGEIASRRGFRPNSRSSTPPRKAWHTGSHKPPGTARTPYP
jgi:hypothetical protein